MRRWLLASLGLAAGAAVLLLTERRAEPPDRAPPVVATEAAPEAPAPTPPHEPAPPPQEAALPPLPEQDVTIQPVHPVPDYRTAPIPHVTVEDRNGNPIGRSVAAPAPPAPAAPAPTPRAPAPTPSAPSPPSRTQPAPAPMPATLTGTAQATGTTMLALQGHSIRLFGIAAPASGDRCKSGRRDPLPCAEVAQQTLAEHLARSASITCAAPPGASAATPARICLDDQGVDIAGFLVGEGLALDDPRQTQDYSRAEGVARSLKKGLWAYR